MLRRGAHHAKLVTQQLAPMPGPAVCDYYPCVSALSYGVIELQLDRFKADVW